MDGTMKDKMLQFLYSLKNKKKAGFFCLIDPDKQPLEKSALLAEKCQKNGVDAILVGGSLMIKDNFNDTVRVIKEKVTIPVLVFPGIFNFVSPYADAILFLSMMSSRNPQLLIGEQVRTAPLIKKYDVEAIPTGYFLIESGSLTSVQFMSGSLPIPRTKYDIAVSHALAAQYLGMKLIFFDGGSGAKHSVPAEMIKKVKENISIPMIIGGGIKTPQEAREKISAGADFIVIGTAIEKNDQTNIIKEFTEAIHS